MPIIPKDVMRHLLVDDEIFEKSFEPDAKKTFLWRLKYQPEEILADITPCVPVAVKSVTKSSLIIADQDAHSAAEEVIAALKEKFKDELESTTPDSAPQRQSFYCIKS
ncbi:MAG TPA: hypothetical protein VL335_02395 [Candidatus Paceibacterota bacterium]|jgi:hypothetical protein|nr:hypothetical protein [Candidatus Paceibacterota bacterium]